MKVKIVQNLGFLPGTPGYYSSASLVRAFVVRGTSVVRGFKRQIFSSHFYF